MTNTSLSIGLVGAGFLARARVAAWRKISGAELSSVCSSTREGAASFAASQGINDAAADLDELLAREDIQAVDICVPNRAHREIVERAARAGKHILCTKPMAAYVGQDLDEGADEASVGQRDRKEMLRVACADAEAMVSVAAENGVILAYAENWVHAPSIQRAAGLISASGGCLLEMRGWESHSGSHSEYSTKWVHAGGGALLRLGAHPIGAMLYLKREEGLQKSGAPILPVAVSAEVADLSQSAGLSDENCRIARGWVDVENWGCCVISFSDGSRGVAYGSDNKLGGMQSKLELSGSNYHIDCKLSPVDLVKAYASDEGVFEDEYLMEKLDSRAGWSTPIPDESWCSGQFAMLEDFRDAIQEGRAPRSDGALGLAVTRVVYAAYLAASEGRRVEL
ncbi:MAG: Gfo/Idh/MocA family oxidoreductase [Planctomycetota bacterium]|nr:Gfo/Idh/MocA family oxidoreductase [Planctomycetota bacterium]